MALFNRLGIQSKIMLMMLAVAILSIGTVAAISYSNAKTALLASTYGHLTSVRAAKRIQVEALFRNIRNETSNLANDRMMVSMLKELSGAFATFRTAKIDPAWDEKLLAYYRDDYLPKLAKATGQTPRLEAFLPQTPEARYAQFWYIANSKFPPGERHKLHDAGDGSEFSAVHGRYQPVLSKLMLDFGYDNLLLVDQESGDVVYTFRKSQIFGTNLVNGPYARSSAGALFQSLRKSQNANEVQVVDFSPAPYSTGRPEALMGAPVLDGPNQTGVLLLQFPLDEINRVMTDDFNWSAAGMGKTGKSYLVGPDKFMRSTARSLYESPADFYRGLEKAGYSSEDVDRVRRLGVATLTLPILGTYVDAALEGKEGTVVAKNYVGEPALVSYSPVRIAGLHWIVVSEMSAGEAFAALSGLSRNILILSCSMILLVTVAAAFLGRGFVAPIFRLVEASRRLRAGDKNVSVDVDSHDEFADLGNFFNEMSREVVSMGEAVERATRERSRLIDNMLPPPAAARMQSGRDQVVDEFSEVSVLYAEFDFSADLPAHRPLGILQDLIPAVDDSAEKRGVEKLACNGSIYIAACGISRQRLDQAIRVLDFARDIGKIVRRMNRDQGAGISLRIGLGGGKAAGGVLGKTRIGYHLSGEAMDLARALARRANAGGILASRRIVDGARGLYRFESPFDAAQPGGETIAAWLLAPEPAPEASPEVSYAH